MKFNSFVIDPSHPEYEEHVRAEKEFEEEYGEDWDSTIIEYDNDFVNLPEYVAKAAFTGNFRIVLQWLHKGKDKREGQRSWKHGASIFCSYQPTTQFDVLFVAKWCGRECPKLRRDVCRVRP